MPTNKRKDRSGANLLRAHGYSIAPLHGAWRKGSGAGLAGNSGSRSRQSL